MHALCSSLNVNNNIYFLSNIRELRALLINDLKEKTHTNMAKEV